MLTGANMGGKSVALQLAGLMLLCGASGLPAPAVRVLFPRVDFVEVLAGQEQGSRHGLSSFGSEVVAWKSLLERPGSGFVIADEPARTTSPADGAALLEGLVAAVSARGWHGWFATHFGEAGQGVAVSAWAVAGLRGAVTESELLGEGSLAALESRMDYRLVPADGAAASDALRVASALGLGDEVLSIARQFRASVESGSNRSS
jgi:DNA mismatch repair ATPase MutS